MSQYSSKSDWKPRTYLVGVVGGILVGLLSAHLYARQVDEVTRGEGERPEIATLELLSLGTAIFAIVQRIASLGGRSDSRRNWR